MHYSLVEGNVPLFDDDCPDFPSTMENRLQDLNSGLTAFWPVVDLEMESQVRFDDSDKACSHLLFERQMGHSSRGKGSVKKCKLDRDVVGTKTAVAS